MGSPPSRDESVSDAGAELRHAIAAHKAGRTDEAAEGYRHVLTREPGHARALYLYGVLLGQKGDAAESAKLISEAIKYAPDNAFYCNDHGNVLLALDRVQESISAYERALTLKPDFAIAHFNLANAYRRLGTLAVAIGSYDRQLRSILVMHSRT